MNRCPKDNLKSLIAVTWRTCYSEFCIMKLKHSKSLGFCQQSILWKFKIENVFMLLNNTNLILGK